MYYIDIANLICNTSSEMAHMSSHLPRVSTSISRIETNDASLLISHHHYSEHPTDKEKTIKQLIHVANFSDPFDI